MAARDAQVEDYDRMRGLRAFSKIEIPVTIAQVRPGPDEDNLAVVGYIAVAHFRALTEADGLYQWRTEFGFSIRRDGLPNLGTVKWVSAYAV